jgi:hypothetical protein
MAKPIIVSKEDYDKGNYPKGVPIMVGISMNPKGRGGMSVGSKDNGTKIVIRLKAA